MNNKLKENTNYKKNNFRRRLINFYKCNLNYYKNKSLYNFTRKGCLIINNLFDT